MKTLIIEDERRAANRLLKMIHDYDSSIQVIGRIDSVKNAVTWFNSNTLPDLVFMDVQLADGLCFDIFEETSVMVPVIFTTAFDEFAIKAFKVNSIDYLLKPIFYKDFRASMDKFRLLQNNPEVVKNNIEKAKQSLSRPHKSRFVVRIGEQLHTIRVEDISCFVSKEKMTYLFKKDNKKFIIDYTLEQLEQLLSPETYFRINRKCLVNMDSIKDIRVYLNNRLKISIDHFNDSEEMVVSREKVQDFKNWLDR